MNMPAMVKCQGDPRIRPYAPVLIENTGPLTDGFWIPNQVKHMFARLGDYQIEMNVTTDGTGVNASTVTRQDPSDVVGVVNLTEALNNNGVTSVVGKSTQVRLVSYTTIQKEDGQGYARTPSRWVYASNGGN
jgi:hypothetical protein